MDKTETPVSKNLEWLMAKARTNPHELQRATGVPQPTIHRILTGVSSDPRTQTLQPLADFFQVSINDLRTRDLAVDDYFGEGTGPYKRIVVVKDSDPTLTHIPKVRFRVAAGNASFEVEPDDDDGSTTTVPTSWVERGKLSTDKLVAMKVGGESMAPTLFPDDVVVINTADTEPEDGNVYLVNYEGESVIKRLERDAGEWWLKSDNIDQRKYGRKVWSDDSCIIIGRVVRKESNHV